MINGLLVADSVAQIKHFAVAIRKYPNHTHAGVLYVSPTEGGPPFLLHLGAPGQLRREVWNQEWGWSAVGVLTRDELFQLSILCQHVFEAKEEIPYGFKYSSGTKFLRNGRMQVADGHKGLTCSTFALSLFSCFEIAILELSSWPVRPDDAVAIHCIAMAQNDPAVEAEFPCARYRPEEVLAGCMANAKNVPYAAAEPLGRQVLEKMSGYLDRKRSGI